MINKYRRPGLSLKNWCVTKENLHKLYEFFTERFGIDNIPIEVETASGNNKVYNNFNEFLEYMPKLIVDKERIEKIIINHRVSDLKNWSKNKQIWIRIDFHLSSVEFYIVAEDTDGTYKDWVDGAYEEMRRIFSSFQYDNEFIKIMNQEYKSKRGYGDSVIVFDYNGEITKKIEDKIEIEDKTEIDKSRTSKQTYIKKPWYKQWWMFYLVYPFIVTLITGLFIVILSQRF